MLDVLKCVVVILLICGGCRLGLLNMLNEICWFFIFMWVWMMELRKLMLVIWLLIVMLLDGDCESDSVFG